MFVCIYVYVYIYVCMYVCIYIYIHIHIYIYIGRHSAGIKHRAMLELACGEYMAVFDDDDYYSAGTLVYLLTVS